MGPLPAGHAAHHIVAHSAPRADLARQLLDSFRIDINSAENGVYLPRGSDPVKYANPNGMAVHSKLHTNEYYDAVNDALLQAANREDAVQILDEIRKSLQQGGYP